MKQITLAVLLLATLAALSQENAAAADTVCPPLTAVTSLPMKGDPVSEAHKTLLSEPECEKVLLAQVTSDQLMPDPRCPVYLGFAEGDLATFLLLERLGLGFEQIMPADAWAKFDTQGVYAYFDFVSREGGRAYIQERLTQLVKNASRHAN